MFTVSLAPIYDHNIGAVHQLVNAAFPVGFSERLVAKMLEQPASRAFSRLGEFEAASTQPITRTSPLA